MILRESIHPKAFSCRTEWLSHTKQGGIPKGNVGGFWFLQEQGVSIFPSLRMGSNGLEVPWKLPKPQLLAAMRNKKLEYRWCQDTGMPMGMEKAHLETVFSSGNPPCNKLVSEFLDSICVAKEGKPEFLRAGIFKLSNGYNIPNIQRIWGLFVLGMAQTIPGMCNRRWFMGKLLFGKRFPPL